MTTEREAPQGETCRFTVEIIGHTEDAANVLDCPQSVRDLIAGSFDLGGIEEEIDYTLEVKRVHG